MATQLIKRSPTEQSKQLVCLQSEQVHTRLHTHTHSLIFVRNYNLEIYYKIELHMNFKLKIQDTFQIIKMSGN